MFSKYISLPIFLISLAIGLFIVYITIPDGRIIYVYPTHENINKLQYKDTAGICFSIEEMEVTCPANENEISKIPHQV